MGMCGFIVFLLKEGVIYKCLYPPSLTRICLSSHAFSIPSAGYFNALAKIIAVAIMYQTKLN